MGACLVCFMVCGGGGFQTCRHPSARALLSPVLGLQRPSHRVSQEAQNDQVPRPLEEVREVNSTHNISSDGN